MSAGFIPTNDGQVCVWIGLPTLTSGMMRSLDRTFTDTLDRAAPEARERLARAERVGRLFAFPGEVGYQRQPCGPGWALVGDASHFKDPLSTHGITDALRDAEFLADAICEAGAGPASEAAAFRTYHATRNHLSDGLFRATDALAGYDWHISEVPGLLKGLAAAMKEELDVLAQRDWHGRHAA